MDYQDYKASTFTRKAPKTSVDVEVILYAFDEENLHIKLDENSQVQRVPRFGIRLDRTNYPYATLTMSERRAINLGLI